MLYYISKNYKDTSSAGNKAKTDIERIMSQNGYENAGLPQKQIGNAVGGFLYTLASVLRVASVLHRGDILVLQYPFKKYFSLLCSMAHLRGAKVVTVIHDLGSFRRKKLAIEQEISRLNHADYIIAHNAAMRRWLEENGIAHHVGELGIFDYLSEAQCKARDVHRPYKVIYAGGLNPRKNAFLYKFAANAKSENYTFHVYGNGFDTMANANNAINYGGFVPSEQMIATCDGDFGLVWDGEKMDACVGDFGEYLRYNNPHKTSFYVRCGLPIVIWNKAALAPFVKANNIGICVDSLAQLDEQLSQLTETEYQTMKQNVVEMSKQLSRGHYITAALEEAVKQLKN